MNIHHLELFYYVALHGGISEAVRKFPYGIQQPAVSGQIIQLESDLGVRLFHRRPFALTPAGRQLYAFIQPFFAGLEGVGEQIRGGATQAIRMAAPEIILRHHLPAILQSVRRQFPKLKLTLRAAHQPQVEQWFERQEIDFAVTLLESKLGAGLYAEPLIKLPLAFLVPASSPAQSAGDVLEAIASGTTPGLSSSDLDPPPPLITLPPNEMAPRLFREWLADQGVQWPPSIEVNALELIEIYVSNGFGIGLTLGGPATSPDSRCRLLPAPEIGTVTVGAIWRDKLTPLTQCLLEALRDRARQMLLLGALPPTT